MTFETDSKCGVALAHEASVDEPHAHRFLRTSTGYVQVPEAVSRRS